MSDEIIMGEPWEGFTKADLQAIVEQLELCKFSCEAGALEHNVAFQELKRIASDKHSIAACLANYCNSHGMTLLRPMISAAQSITVRLLW